MLSQFLKATMFCLLLASLSISGFGQDAGSAEAKKSDDKKADNLPSGINDSFLDPNMKF